MASLLKKAFELKLIMFLECCVKNLEGLNVGLYGLGPLNWIAKKVKYSQTIL
jgi:hypothetical protein